MCVCCVTFPLEETSLRASTDVFLLLSATYRSLFSHFDHDRQPKWAETQTHTHTHTPVKQLIKHIPM